MFGKWRVENPVLRHAGRLTSPGRAVALTAGVLLLVAIAALALQQFWVQVALYAGRPRLYARWFMLFLLAEVLIVVPWAAIRGASVWRRMEVDGHLDEYRRTRLSPLAIVGGALYGALKPVLAFLGISAALGLVVCTLGQGQAATTPGQPGALQALAAHGLLLVLALSYATFGQFLASRLRLPAVAVPICLALLAASVAAIWVLNPYYRQMGDPDRWVAAFLLPNPVATVGTLLDLDILRNEWVYEQIRAQDYFSMAFRYPWPGWTALVYGGLAAIAILGTTARLARRGENR